MTPKIQNHSCNLRLRRAAVLACAAVLMFSAGCNRPGPHAREFARRFMSDADAARRRVQVHHDDMAAGRRAGAFAEGPPFAIILEVQETARLYQVRLGMYEKAAGDDAPAADKELIGKLGQARDSLRDCAFQLLEDVKSKLPAYRLHYKYKDTGPDPDHILNGVRRDLGVEPHTTPSADSCARYDRLSEEIRRSL